MVAFPVIKLAALAIKQISKPIAKAIKARAVSSPLLRRAVMVPAQLFHSWETNVRMRVLGLGKAKEVKPLNEQMAVEQGADLLSEIFLFSVGAGIIAFEYRRKAVSDEKKENALTDSIATLQNQVQELGIMLETQDAHIRELNRQVFSTKNETKKS